MQLLLLFLLLTFPYFVLTLLNPWTSLQTKPSIRARIRLSVFFAFTAIGHFIRTDEMSAMLPPWVPYRGSIIYHTSVLELLGAIGVWLPGLTRLTGLCLILMLITFFPANIYSAINRIEFGGHGAGPSYLLARVPFQLFLIW